MKYLWELKTNKVIKSCFIKKNVLKETMLRSLILVSMENYYWVAAYVKAVPMWCIYCLPPPASINYFGLGLFSTITRTVYNAEVFLVALAQ